MHVYTKEQLDAFHTHWSEVRREHMAARDTADGADYAARRAWEKVQRTHQELVEARLMPSEMQPKFPDWFPGHLRDVVCDPVCEPSS